MNQLKGKIVHIESSDSLSIVEMIAHGHTFTCILLETPKTAKYLHCGNSIFLVFKESCVSIGRNISGQLSLRNRFPLVISEIQSGEILTKLILDFLGEKIISVITTKSAKAMRLEPGNQVEGLVKSSDIALLECSEE